MKYWISIVLISLSFTVFAQEASSNAAIPFSYDQGIKVYFKWSGKQMPDAEFDQYLSEYYERDYDQKRNNEFQWKPFFTNMKNNFKTEVDQVDLKAEYWRDFDGELGEYEFDNEGFFGFIVYKHTSRYVKILGDNKNQWENVTFRNNSRLTDIVLLLQDFKNSYLVKVDPETAENYVESLPSSYFGYPKRKVTVRVYFTLDDPKTKDKLYADFIKGKSSKYGIPAKVTKYEIYTNGDKMGEVTQRIDMKFPEGF